VVEDTCSDRDGVEGGIIDDDDDDDEAGAELEDDTSVTATVDLGAEDVTEVYLEM
jgi:hypothetical protein